MRVTFTNGAVAFFATMIPCAAVAAGAIKVAANPASIEQRMTAATDWFALAKEILPQARDGNPEAQLALFDMYRHCFDSSGINRKKSNYLSEADALNFVREETLKWSGSRDSRGTSLANGPAWLSSASWRRCDGARSISHGCEKPISRHILGDWEQCTSAEP